MNTRFTVKAAVTAAAVLAIQACSHFPEQVPTLDQARQAVSALENEPLANDVAPTRLKSAQAALSRADELYSKKESLDEVEQNAYVALRNAQIGQQQVAQRQARDELRSATAERDKILLEAKEQQLHQRSQQLAETQQQLQQQSRQAAQAQERSQKLQQQLSDLKTQQTERGLVLTLNDVLFDTDSATLKPGADRAIQRVADYMMQNPQRDILIEGYTDSRGSEEYNVDLSSRRAQSVKQALVARGISADRIDTNGLGEEYPVASNDTAAGRQLNRRVEIVLSDQNGRFSSGQRESRAEERPGSGRETSAG